MKCMAKSVKQVPALNCLHKTADELLYYSKKEYDAFKNANTGPVQNAAATSS